MIICHIDRTCLNDYNFCLHSDACSYMTDCSPCMSFFNSEHDHYYSSRYCYVLHTLADRIDHYTAFSDMTDSTILDTHHAYVHSSCIHDSLDLNVFYSFIPLKPDV